MSESATRTQAVVEKITLAELQRRIVDPDTGPEDLAPYVVEDEASSEPFAPAVRLNPATVEVPTERESEVRGEASLGFLSWLERQKRHRRFENHLAAGYDGPIIVSEGDSWFQYPVRLHDTIDHLSETFAVRSLGRAGDTMERMVRRADYLNALVEDRAQVFLFSGGGNDALGSGKLEDLLRDHDATLEPEAHILPAFDRLLDGVIASYDTLFRSVESLPGTIRILCHGYDVPGRIDGRWFAAPMAKRGIDDPARRAAIVKAMFGRFNARLKQLSAGFSDVRYLDLRGTAGAKTSRWYDELHPTSQAFGDVAHAFAKAIRAVRPSRRAPRPARALPAQSARTVIARSRGTARGRKGWSLHVGINRLDPGHYGSDAPLDGCEFDAEDMAAIAEHKGFEVKALLRSEEAKREAVLGFIDEAAGALDEGDIFFFSYAGHGTQIPDLNDDERDSDGQDETFCLFDGMLIDDELFSHLTRFKPGVRVLIVSDSCHSGSVARVAFDGTPLPEPGPNRLLPASISGRAYRSHRDFYRSLTHIDERLLTRPLAATLSCSVVLLAACQDNQYAGDTPSNGRFTQELLQAWNDGRFTGDYRRLHRTIMTGMPPDQTPNLFPLGQRSEAFLAQSPFSV